MKVRAKADGVYNGYFRHGPVDNGEGGFIPGEVFEIQDGEFPLLDPESKKPILEPVFDKHGKPIMDRIEKQAVNAEGSPIFDKKGQPVMAYVEVPKMKPKMWSWFAPWMEKVAEDIEVTYDREPFKVPVQYREGKKKLSLAPTPAATGVLPVI